MSEVKIQRYRRKSAAEIALEWGGPKLTESKRLKQIIEGVPVLRPCDNGEYVLFSDLEAYVAAQVERVLDETGRPCKQYEIVLRHDDRSVFLAKLRILLEPFPEVFEQARKEERERCRRDEVQPLMDACGFAKSQICRGSQKKALPVIRSAIAVVEAVQREKP